MSNVKKLKNLVCFFFFFFPLQIGHEVVEQQTFTLPNFTFLHFYTKRTLVAVFGQIDLCCFSKPHLYFLEKN